MIRLAPIAALALWLGVSPAHADGRRPALHWSRGAGAEGCIDPRRLAERVQQLTGPVLVDPARADLSIEAHVDAPAPQRFEVRVSATRHDGRPRGTRTLSHQGPDCRALDDALVFVIAVLIDPDLALAELPASLVALGAEGGAPEAQLLGELSATPPVPLAPVDPEPAPPPSAPAAVAVPEPPSARGPLGLRVGLVASALLLPRAALGPSLGVSYGVVRALAVELSLAALPMVGRHELDVVRSVTARAYGVELLVCPQRAGSRTRVAVCAGPDMTLVRAQGEGFSSGRVATLASYGVSAAPTFSVRVSGGFWLHARAGVRLALNTARFQATRPALAPREVFSVGRFAPFASLALGVEF